MENLVSFVKVSINSFLSEMFDLLQNCSLECISFAHKKNYLFLFLNKEIKILVVGCPERNI